MIGSLFALFSGICFAFSDIFIRRAVLKFDEAAFGTLITVPMAVPLLFLALVFTGEVGSVLSFSWQSYIWLSLAGICFTVVGRSLSYKCIQLVGANIAGIFRRINILVAVITGIVALHEPLSWTLVIGVSLIIMGITLSSLNPHGFRNSPLQASKIPAKAFLLGFGSGTAWGVAPIFVKLGLEGNGSPLAGVFIAFSAATVVLSVFFVNRRIRSIIANISGKTAFLFCLAGFSSCVANLTHYVALSLAPASVVTPLIATYPVFVLILSFIFNRNIEIFNRPIIIGTLTIVFGTILLV